MFQYPQTDRRGCNSRVREDVFDELGCFSIHKRIEGGATGRPMVFLWCIQCVSVSTNGSKGVQPLDIIKAIVGKKGFSIHKRIEGGATRQIGNILLPRLKFQYPQTDRRGCNNPKTSARTFLLFVSVSTNGSKGVQLAFILSFLSFV